MSAELLEQDRAIGRARQGLLAARPILYIVLILGVALAAYAYKLRTEGILACPAAGYSSDWYLAYCHATGYGDYEHGSFWFDLEPAAANFATNADVLFLGSSRMQIALSTAATSRWFETASVRYYLMGFGYTENVVFARELLRRFRPRAKVYVINIDQFFVQSQTVPAKSVMEDSAARLRYEAKHLWQLVHRPICRTVPAICGDTYVIFRSRSTGAYKLGGLGQFRGEAVSYDRVVDRNAAAGQAATGKEFLASLPVDRECVILTMIPYVDTKIETAAAIATALGMELIAPTLDGLQTFDGSHLEHASAERWSKAFLQAAGPRIRKCLDGSDK